MALLTSTLAWAETSAQGPSEYQVKAAFLYNFVKFVEWPAAAIDPQEPITLCVLGKDPFGDALSRAIEGKSVNGHRIATRRIAEAAKAQSCHVLFVSASESGRAAEIIRAVRSWNVLTVSEIDRFLDTPVKRYSSGMYVRLAFAVAAHLEPEILVVDEVLAVGDVVPSRLPSLAAQL